ncbi:MAG: hypothetical protein HON90_11555 [Halobacteriovoraceae bacterium]|nr:hypothetical protein [Halobacteriovoraceae bacterium]
MRERTSLDNNVANNPIQCGLSSVVAADLKLKLSEFKDPKKGLRILSEQMGIHPKTLRRLIAQENRPGYLTLYKIYRIIFSTSNDTEILKLVPKVVADEIKKLNPKKLSKEVTFSSNVEKVLLNDPVALEIYFLAGTAPISKDMVAFRFGTYGSNKLKSLLKDRILQVLESGMISLGENRTNFSPELIKMCGIQLTEHYSKPVCTDEMGQNYLAIYGSSLSQDAYNEWLRIDEQAYYKKAELAKQASSKGSIRAYTFISTDTLTQQK